MLVNIIVNIGQIEKRQNIEVYNNKSNCLYSDKKII